MTFRKPSDIIFTACWSTWYRAHIRICWSRINMFKGSQPGKKLKDGCLITCFSEKYKYFNDMHCHSFFFAVGWHQRRPFDVRVFEQKWGV